MPPISASAACVRGRGKIFARNLGQKIFVPLKKAEIVQVREMQSWDWRSAGRRHRVQSAHEVIVHSE